MNITLPAVFEVHPGITRVLIHKFFGSLSLKSAVLEYSNHNLAEINDLFWISKCNWESKMIQRTNWCLGLTKPAFSNTIWDAYLSTNTPCPGPVIPSVEVCNFSSVRNKDVVTKCAGGWLFPPQKRCRPKAWPKGAEVIVVTSRKPIHTDTKSQIMMEHPLQSLHRVQTGKNTWISIAVILFVQKNTVEYVSKVGPFCCTDPGQDHHRWIAWHVVASRSEGPGFFLPTAEGSHRSSQNRLLWCVIVMLPSGKLTVCYWKWPFIADLPIENGDFPQLC